LYSKNPKGSPQFINYLNRIKILNLIREHGEISRAELASLSGISAPTVTRVVDRLINDDKLIKEIGIGQSSGGRRPTLLQFAGIDNYVIGIDLGKTHIDGILANLNAQTILELRYNTRLEEGFESIMERTVRMICELKNHSNVKDHHIFGIGMAVAGLINRYKNIVELSPDFQWENADVKKAIEEKTKLPVIFNNVSRVMAIGELFYGIGKELKNFIVINLGYGIGSGIVLEGTPVEGSLGMAGEFGHMVMDINSEFRCDCGNYGCLEALSSGRAIARNAKLSIKKGRKSKIIDLVNNNIEEITAETVAIACREGDHLAKEIFDNAIEILGIAISNIVDLLDPEVVLIGGGVAQADDLVFDHLREVVKKYTVRTKTDRVKILPATFGVKAAVKGSIALILNEVLNLRYSKTLSIY
jgi:glucokinase-like ROK family protein